jgi:hypothetical protein
MLSIQGIILQRKYLWVLQKCFLKHRQNLRLLLINPLAQVEFAKNYLVLQNPWSV